MEKSSCESIDSLFPIIDDVNEISLSQLEQIMHIGFCYVKLPHDEHYSASYEKVYNNALRFFRQPKTEKMKFAYDQVKAQGYNDRRDKSAAMRFEQFFCRPYDPIGPLASEKESITIVTQLYHEKIAKPILSQILTHLGMKKHYHELTDKFFSSISFPYYPEDPNGQFSSEVAAHKDFELITVLSINQPGLQVWYNNAWHDVLPRPGCVVVNLSNTLEVITSHQCKSALHRVIIPNKDQDRMSMGLFVGLELEKPVVDLKTGQQLFPSAIDFIKYQLSGFGMEDLEIKPTEEGKCSLDGSLSFKTK